MNWLTISGYLIAHWVELAGFITTSVGIWLTTKRLLICWPVVLAADIFYFAVFYQARLFSDALLQIFFLAFTLYGGGTGGEACAKREKFAWRRSRYRAC